MNIVTATAHARQLKIRTAFRQWCDGCCHDQILELLTCQDLCNPVSGKLGYADHQFAWIACYELIESMPDRQAQYLLLLELFRIARLGLFVSTVNRRHPIDMRSGWPFVHWLGWHDCANLLDAQSIREMANALPGKPAWKLGHVRFAGIKSHFFLMIKK